MRQTSKTIMLGLLFTSGILITIIGDYHKESIYTDSDTKGFTISPVSGRIHIVGNSMWEDFKNDGYCTGEGTYTNPYIIQDLIIDAGGLGSCIRIEDSDVYFRIMDCILFRASSYYYAAIKLLHVSNAQLINNDCSFNDYGIHLIRSDSVIISGNTVNNNTYVGVVLDQSDNNTITGNIINYNNNCGVYLEESDNNIVSGNNLMGNHICISERDCKGNKFEDNEYCDYTGIKEENKFGIIFAYIITGLTFGFFTLGITVIFIIKRLKRS